MCNKTLGIFLIFIFSISCAYAETSKTAVNFHLSFENFDFMEEDFVARSGFKSIDDRGLTLEEGRFGKGLQMNLVPNIPQQDEMTGIDLDMVTAVTFNTRHHKGGGWVLYNEPILWD